jgi:hypothetical protein
MTMACFLNWSRQEYYILCAVSELALQLAELRFKDFVTQSSECDLYEMTLWCRYC